MLEKLKERNIKFVAASGRPYKTLYENFKPKSDYLDYICDNGSYVVLNDMQPVINGLKKDVVHAVIKACEKIENTVVILCGVNGAYHMPCSDDYLSISFK